MKRFSTDTLKLEKTTSNYFDLVEGFAYWTAVAEIPALEGCDYWDHVVESKFELSDWHFNQCSPIVIQPFKTDLASVPWWVQWRLKKYGVYDFAAVVHDYILQHREGFPKISRKEIDMIFREAMIDLGVPERECRLMYYGVRLNSWWKEERFYDTD